MEKIKFLLQKLLDKHKEKEEQYKILKKILSGKFIYEIQ